MKTLLTAITLGALLSPAAWGLPNSPSERVKLFATCAGRLSALEEHQRLFDGPASERTARRKAQFDDVIAALLPHAVAYGMPGRQALAWQVEAKMAQAVLLHRAQFGTDPIGARRAETAWRARLKACDGVLLGS